MQLKPLPRRLLAEFIGSLGLLAIVIGSGIMAERLAGGNTVIALLANTLATMHDGRARCADRGFRPDQRRTPQPRGQRRDGLALHCALDGPDRAVAKTP